jgi:RNA polymerase sigma factor (sigma-70 family)
VFFAKNFRVMGREGSYKLHFEEKTMNLSPVPAKQAPILPRIAQGEADAFEDFINQYGNLVWSIAKKFAPTTEDAEDAAQEVFMEIWQNAGRFDATKASEVTFISIIARRRLIDRVRKIYRQPAFQSIEDTFETQPNVFEREILTNIEAKKAVQAMEQVRPEQRELMMLTIFEGMSHGEIAEKTNLPLGTVKTHIRRGFERVRKIMSRNAFQQTAAA